MQAITIRGNQKALLFVYQPVKLHQFDVPPVQSQFSGQPKKNDTRAHTCRDNGTTMAQRWPTRSPHVVTTFGWIDWRRCFDHDVPFVVLLPQPWMIIFDKVIMRILSRNWRRVFMNTAALLFSCVRYSFFLSSLFSSLFPFFHDNVQRLASGCYVFMSCPTRGWWPLAGSSGYPGWLCLFLCCHEKETYT